MNVLDYFEQLATSPRQYAKNLSIAHLSPEIQQAILKQDQTQLKILISDEKTGHNLDLPPFADMQRVYQS